MSAAKRQSVPLRQFDELRVVSRSTNQCGAEVQPTDTVLEIGTGLGYQSAIMAELAHRVFTVEIITGRAPGAQELAKTGGLATIDVAEATPSRAGVAGFRSLRGRLSAPQG